VQRLRHGDETNRFVGQPALLSRRDAIFNFGMRNCRSDLFPARIGGDYPVEPPGKVERGLAVSAGAVPNTRVFWSNCGEIVEPLRWIVRTEIRVSSRNFGKMVVE